MADERHEPIRVEEHNGIVTTTLDIPREATRREIDSALGGVRARVDEEADSILSDEVKKLMPMGLGEDLLTIENVLDIARFKHRKTSERAIKSLETSLSWS